MLLEKYDPVNLFELVPLEMDPVLGELDPLLDEDELFQGVKADLSRRYPLTLTAGRNSTPVEVILRMLTVKHLYQWSYEETERFVADSIVLRQFCRVYLQAVPDDTVLLRWANLIQPGTLHRLLEHVAKMAQRLKVTRGRKLRSDGTVVETNIHYPSDSSLLADGVRVLSRAVKRVQTVLREGSVDLRRELFRDASRSARQVARQIADQARKAKGTIEQEKGYRHLVDIAKASVRRATKVLQVLRTQGVEGTRQVVTTLEQVIPRVEQVIEQTTRRVLEHQVVPAAEKLVSIFEPHTDIIRRGKVNKPTEFGHRVWLDEVDGGIVTDYRVLQGNPPDQEQWPVSLEHHIQRFGRPPQQASADRSVYSAANEAYARQQGIQRIILPQPGRRSPERLQQERQRWFRQGRRFHSGIEGRISVLQRKHGLDRCLYHGDKGFERWVGWGIIAANLAVIATTLISR